MNILFPLFMLQSWFAPDAPLPAVLTTGIAQQAPVVIPYVENFDSGFPGIWINDSTESAEDWRHSGTVQSTYGPDASDHTTGNGAYMWIDDSSPHTSEINLISPCFDLTGTQAPLCEFWLWSENENAGNSDVILHLDVKVAGNWILDVVPALTSAA